jgi:hypothetical protein
MQGKTNIKNYVIIFWRWCCCIINYISFNTLYDEKSPQIEYGNVYDAGNPSAYAQALCQISVLEPKDASRMLEELNESREVETPTSCLSFLVGRSEALLEHRITGYN